MEGQTQAGLQMDSQKLQSIRMANDTSASKGDSSSVPIRDIRGSNFYILDSSTPPSAWFGFRLRAYEAWRDLEKFFPAEEDELKNEVVQDFRNIVETKYMTESILFPGAKNLITNLINSGMKILL